MLCAQPGGNEGRTSRWASERGAGSSDGRSLSGRQFRRGEIIETYARVVAPEALAKRTIKGLRRNSCEVGKRCAISHKPIQPQRNDHGVLRRPGHVYGKYIKRVGWFAGSIRLEFHHKRRVRDAMNRHGTGCLPIS